MTFVLLDNLLQLAILSADFVHVLWVKSHLFEVNKNSPAPVLQLLFTLLTFDLDADEPAGLEERYDILWEGDNLI